MRMNMRAAVVVVLAVSLLGLTACGGRQATPPAAGGPAPKPSVELLVWSHLTPPEIEAVDALAQQWAAQTGNKVTVLQDQSGFQEFAVAARSGQGPDIMFGLPHDNLGTFHRAGLLAAVPDGFLNKAAYVPMTLDSVNYEGKLFAVPLAMETTALIINKKLVPQPPRTLSELVTMAKGLTGAGQYGFMYDIKNFYFTFAFLSGHGAYVFKQTDQGLDPKDVGLATTGGVQGWKFLADVVRTHQLMPLDVDYNTAVAQFSAGKVGMTINGPWALSGFKDAGIDYAVVPLPTRDDGTPLSPFVGVQTAFVNALSPKQEAAWELLRFLTEQSAMRLFETGNRIPARLDALNDPKVQSNADLRAYAEQAKVGTPMPNIPEMQAVWTPAGNALTLVLSGDKTPEQAAQDAVRDIQQNIAGMQ